MLHLYKLNKIDLASSRERHNFEREREVILTEFKEMEHQETSAEIFEKFTLKTENSSRMNVEKIYSEPFVVIGYPWVILLYLRGAERRQLLINLFEAMQTANMSKE